MVLSESGLNFVFYDSVKAVKFDDTAFYRELFNALPGGKGVDFIAYNKNIYAMIEIKNCLGDEGNNRWRIEPDNNKKNSSKAAYDIGDRDSLDIEVAQKVAMSIATLYGAGSYGDSQKKSEELIDYFRQLSSDDYAVDQRKIVVILFLEGDFAVHTRSEKMVLKRLQDSMRKKLRWLKCKVCVVNSNTYREGLPQEFFELAQG